MVNRWSSPGWARGRSPVPDHVTRLAGRRAPCTERQSSGPAIIDGVLRVKSPPRRGFAGDGLGCPRKGRRRRTARTAIRHSARRGDQTGDRDVQTLWRKASVIRHPLAVHVAPSVASPTPVGGPRGRRCSYPAPLDRHIGHHSSMDEAIVGWGATVLYVGARFRRRHGQTDGGGDASPALSRPPSSDGGRPQPAATAGGRRSCGGSEAKHAVLAAALSCPVARQWSTASGRAS